MIWNFGIRNLFRDDAFAWFRDGEKGIRRGIFMVMMVTDKEW